METPATSLSEPALPTTATGSWAYTPRPAPWRWDPPVSLDRPASLLWVGIGGTRGEGRYQPPGGDHDRGEAELKATSTWLLVEQERALGGWGTLWLGGELGRVFAGEQREFSGHFRHHEHRALILNPWFEWELPRLTLGLSAGGGWRVDTAGGEAGKPTRSSAFGHRPGFHFRGGFESIALDVAVNDRVTALAMPGATSVRWGLTGMYGYVPGPGSVEDRRTRVFVGFQTFPGGEGQANIPSAAFEVRLTPAVDVASQWGGYVDVWYAQLTVRVVVACRGGRAPDRGRGADCWHMLDSESVR